VSFNSSAEKCEGDALDALFSGDASHSTPMYDADHADSLFMNDDLFALFSSDAYRDTPIFEAIYERNGIEFHRESASSEESIIVPHDCVEFTASQVRLLAQNMTEHRWSHDYKGASKIRVIAIDNYLVKEVYLDIFELDNHEYIIPEASWMFHSSKAYLSKLRDYDIILAVGMTSFAACILRALLPGTLADDGTYGAKMLEVTGGKLSRSDFCTLFGNEVITHPWYTSFSGVSNEEVLIGSLFAEKLMAKDFAAGVDAISPWIPRGTADWFKAHGDAKTPCDRWKIGTNLLMMLATGGRAKMVEWIGNAREKAVGMM
jgi:hypothetical protein